VPWAQHCQDLAANPAATLFKRRFGHAPAHLVRAPVALTLLGSLASAADGVLLGVAVDRHVSLAAAPRSDGRIEIVHPLAIDGCAFWLGDFAAESAFEWARPIKTMLAALQQRGVHFSGFSAALHDNVPAGFDARTSLETATLMLIRRVHPFTLTDAGLAAPPRRDPRTQEIPAATDQQLCHLAKLCRAARGGVAGAGLLADPFTPLLGRAWHALAVDWQTGGVERWPFAGTAVVFCDAGELAPGDARIAEFAEALASALVKLNLRSLRSVDPAFLQTNRTRLGPREAVAVSHVAAENRWIVRGESVLREADHRQFGQFLWLSHESARDALQAVSPEAERLVQSARKHPACLGSRALYETGRIATVSLVDYHNVEAFVAHLALEAKRQFGRDIRPLVLPIVDGAG